MQLPSSRRKKTDRRIREIVPRIGLIARKVLFRVGARKGLKSSSEREKRVGSQSVSPDGGRVGHFNGDPLGRTGLGIEGVAGGLQVEVAGQQPRTR